MSIRLPKSASAPSASAISVAIGIAQALEVADPELKIAKINAGVIIPPIAAIIGSAADFGSLACKVSGR
mgnify:CR=1 FL=1